jgi:hypothetical protein
MSAKRVRPVSKVAPAAGASTPKVAPAPAPAPAPPPAWVAKLAGLGRSPLGYILASIFILAPCYWQARIQAGDLSSHIYNSWLAQLAEAGKLPGLVVVNQATNMLFDRLLSGLFGALGPDLAQRIAVSIAVLIFVWGAFAFVSAASGRRAWSLLPCLAVLAYGWVFHMGFFDFYLGLGLNFWGLALAWDMQPKRMAAALAVFILAFFAHALACAWGLAFVAFLWAAKRMGESKRLQVTGVALGALIAAVLIVGNAWRTQWSFDQFKLITGADQLRVYDDKYDILFLALLVVWALMLVQLIRQQGGRQIWLGLPLQFCVLSAAGVFLLPDVISVPGYRHNLVYIAERMSLGVAVCICALLASAQTRALQQWAMAAVGVVFFGFLFHDESALNAFEGRMRQMAMSLPAGQRVLSGADDPSLRINAMAHMIDRACIGHCYSYANYEPSTWQFRVRAVAPNPYVASDYRDSFELQMGRYMVKPQDLPLYEITLDDQGNQIIVNLQSGVPNGIKLCKILPDIL